MAGVGAGRQNKGAIRAYCSKFGTTGFLGFRLIDVFALLAHLELVAMGRNRHGERSDAIQGVKGSALPPEWLRLRLGMTADVSVKSENALAWARNQEKLLGVFLV